MKKLALYSFYVISVSFIMSCDELEPCHRTSSNIISETRDLKDFKGVAFDNSGDFFLTQGPEFLFTIEGPDNVVELTTTRVENELLVIGSDGCFNGDYKLNVEITAPEYRFINFSGIGSLTTVGQIEGDVLVMELMGLGDIEADIYVDSLYTTISGNGTVEYTGEVIRHQFSSSGEVTLNSYSLDTDHTFINLTGIGNNYVHANESLAVVIAGSSIVYYQGNPTVQTEITGSGEVIDGN